MGIHKLGTPRNLPNAHRVKQFSETENALSPDILGNKMIILEKPVSGYVARSVPHRGPLGSIGLSRV
jgi:hypothetical protein